MGIGIVKMSRMRLFMLLAVVAILSVQVADYGVARATDPVPTYYFSTAVGTGPTLASVWAVDTGLTLDSYRIFKVINVQGNPEHSEQRIRGLGPNGYGDYTLMAYVIAPGGDDDLEAYIFVSGL
jgi:hypothetical protein